METANRGAQIVLTHEFRYGPMAQMTVPRFKRHGFLRYRFGHQLNRQHPQRGTLMRHFLLPGPVSTLTFSVGMTPSMRGLIAPAGRSD